MSNWKKISDFITFSTKGITPKYVENSSIIVLNQKCVRNGVIDYSFSQFTDDTKQISETKFVNKGDILINSTGVGTAGRCAFVDELPINKRLITDSHILLLRCNNYFEARCLSYLLFSFEKTLMSFMTGSSGQGELDKVVVLNLLTRLPVNPEIQQKIAKVLSDLDSKIELNNKINAELEQMAKTLYDYWFVQFDFPDANGKPYKSSGGEMVYNADLKREIPKGWEVKTLFKISNVQYGYPFSTDFFNETNNGVPVIRIRDILNNSISNYSNQENIDDKYKISKGDILIGMDGNFHINYWSKNNCYLNQRVVMIKETLLPNIYTRYQIVPYIQLREKSVSRTTVGHLSDKDLKAIGIIYPSKEILTKIKPLFNNYLQKIVTNKQQNEELAKLRDWLLPMLMNGQVTVENDENEVLGMVAEPPVQYEITERTPEWYDERFNLWITNQSLAARGEIDRTTLRELFDAMNDEDK